MGKCEEEEASSIVSAQIGIYTQASNDYFKGDTTTLAKSRDRIQNFSGWFGWV
jgi:hypothetical protein